jgi:hypothetical protein
MNEFAEMIQSVFARATLLLCAGDRAEAIGAVAPAFRFLIELKGVKTMQTPGPRSIRWALENWRVGRSSAPPISGRGTPKGEREIMAEQNDIARLYCEFEEAFVDVLTAKGELLLPRGVGCTRREHVSAPTKISRSASTKLPCLEPRSELGRFWAKRACEVTPRSCGGKPPSVCRQTGTSMK